MSNFVYLCSCINEVREAAMGAASISTFFSIKLCTVYIDVINKNSCDVRTFGSQILWRNFKRNFDASTPHLLQVVLVFVVH
jgi:hypothetical protein